MAERPNIVFFYWDNFGWGELGCYGGGVLRGAPTPQAARRELAALDDRTERLQFLERDRDALLKNYAEMMPEALEALQPEERHHVYKMLRLRVVAFPDGALEVSGALGKELIVCKKPTRGSRSRGT